MLNKFKTETKPNFHIFLDRNSLDAPRVMSCLHVFCEECIVQLMIDETGDSRNCVITCPVCKQSTAVSLWKFVMVARKKNDVFLCSYKNISKLHLCRYIVL